MNMHSKPRRPGGNGGQHRHHNNNRPRRFNNNGNSGGNDAGNAARTRRHAQQQREKYQNMARDAMSMGDRVLAENYLQHADHYHRVILSLPPEEQRHPQHQRHPQSQDAAPGEEHAQEHAGETMPESDEPPAMPSVDALPSFITQQPHKTTQQSAVMPPDFDE